MHTVHKARATMFGLSRHPGHYQGSSARIGARLYRRIAADVAADVAAGRLPATARILDAGTGPGLVPLQIASTSSELKIDAIDLSVEMIDHARRQAITADVADRITFTVADIAALPYPDHTFDLIVSSLSQHHWVDPAAGMSEIARVLRPGAEAWIYDFRFSLRRAQKAGQAGSPALVVAKESPLSGTSRLNPIGRLVLR